MCVGKGQRCALEVFSISSSLIIKIRILSQDASYLTAENVTLIIVAYAFLSLGTLFCVQQLLYLKFKGVWLILVLDQLRDFELAL